MLLGRYSVSYHAMEQYRDRVSKYKSTVPVEKIKSEILRNIRSDLHWSKIKNIVRKHDEDKVHVFTRGSKEFIFIKNAQGFLNLKTVIKRSIKDNERALQKVKEPVKLSS